MKWGSSYLHVALWGLVLLQQIASFRTMKRCNSWQGISVKHVVSNDDLIPVDIDRFTKFTIEQDFASPTSPILETGRYLLPDTTVQSLYGADNLGTLLWTFVLFNGLLTTSGSPSNWILRPLGKVLGQANETWYADYLDNYYFECPLKVDVARAAIFLSLGYTMDRIIVESFGGDSYWGWSIGASLSIPAALIKLARGKPPTREAAELQTKLDNSFARFASKCIVRDSACRVLEDVVVQQFLSRLNVSIPEEKDAGQLVRKTARKFLAIKPDKRGFYTGISLKSPNEKSMPAPSKTTSKAVMEVVDVAQEETGMLPNTAGTDFIR